MADDLDIDYSVIDTKTGQKYSKEEYRKKFPTPWWKPIWWSLKHKWDWIFDQPHEWKRFWQRGRRGWGDRDVWSVEWYLCDIIPPMLRRLKVTKHGVPTECFDLDPSNEDGGIKDDKEGWKIAETRFNAILEDIIYTFETARKIQEYDWDFLVTNNMNEWSDDQYEKRVQMWNNYAKKYPRRDHHVYVMTKEDHERYFRGWKLFQEYFFSLWD